MCCPTSPLPEKRQELFHPDARFLLATPNSPDSGSDSRSSASLPVQGFLHLRYVVNYDLPVLYAFELQVARPWQRAGLGTRLMEAGELISARTGMSRVVLVVFKQNAPAMRLYKERLGYGVDELARSDHEGEDYEVLSKANPHYVDYRAGWQR